MDDNMKDSPDAVDQEVAAVDNDSKEESSSTGDEKYLGQKKRAEKAEAEAKAAKEAREALEQKLADALKNNTQAEPETEAKQPDSLTREEAILYARGFTEEEVQKAAKVAAVEDVSIAAAVDTDLFVSWKEKRDAEAKNQAAQLGASGGSAPHQEQSFKSGMSDADHRALFAKKYNQ